MSTPLHKNIHSVVRSMPWFKWTPGYSKCYNDVSYTKKLRKRRYNFDGIETNFPKDEEEFRNKQLLDALHANGFTECKDVIAHSDYSNLYVYCETPIEIIEVAVTPEELALYRK